MVVTCCPAVLTDYGGAVVNVEKGVPRVRRPTAKTGLPGERVELASQVLIVVLAGRSRQTRNGVKIISWRCQALSGCLSITNSNGLSLIPSRQESCQSLAMIAVL